MIRLLYPGIIWRFEKLLGIGKEKKIHQSLKIVETYMNDAVSAREKSPSDDLLSRFIKKRDGAGKTLSAAALRQIALNFLLAGRDTSSVALSWFFWLVMNHPDVEEKILDELTAVLTSTRGSDQRCWTEEAVDFEEAEKLVYLKAALAETLRLYPSVPEDFKHAIADDVLPDGTAVPAGSTVTYSIYAMGRMKSVWGEDCMEFKPERFLSVQGDRFELPKDGYKFVAFNAGPRTCLGKDLAYLLRYRLSPVPGHRVQQKMSLTLFMKHGLRVFLQTRQLQPQATTSA